MLYIFGLSKSSCRNAGDESFASKSRNYLVKFAGPEYDHCQMRYF
jgi:hypothetical protein